jgi:hypothetical protein
MTTGKWAEPGVPHKGWVCVGVEDLEEADAICEMCRVQEIRYVHWMEHQDYLERLGCGCVCAGRMEEDVVGAKRRERSFIARRKNWTTRKWKRSARGNQYLNALGHRVVIFARGDTWAALIENLITGEKQFSQRPYPTSDAAKLAALNVITNAAGPARRPFTRPEAVRTERPSEARAEEGEGA